MTESVRFDAFLVHYLATELERELAGKSVSAMQFDSAEQRILIDAGGIRLVWELHGAEGSITRTAPLYPLPDSAILPRKARVQSVSAVPYERVLRFALSGERRENATYSIVVELITNQWNAFALDHADKVLRVLKLRDTGRSFRRGQMYQLPERGSEADSYRSALNEQLSDDEFQRMLDEAPQPALITIGDAVNPYPHHLWQEGAQRFESLLNAFGALTAGDSAEAVVNELRRRMNAVVKKMERMNGELAKAAAAEQETRARADVLIAYASTVTRGVSKVVLPGFDGSDVTIELDPKLSASDNAKLLYDEARKHARASKRIPELLAGAEKERARLAELVARAQRGELSAVDAKEIAAKPAVRPQQTPGERLPYRRYRTSGGLEVRVGRNAKSNDELTLQHSSPRDIWLHARHVGGAHVVLRWQDAENNPSLNDIKEAAALAAYHSAARTSRMVPVDYTRRKYVRKPRKSPPGTVMIERAKTVFVEPSAELEEKLRT